MLLFLRRSYDINVKDPGGYTSLHHAALNGYRDIVNLLLCNGASPNVIDSKGSSPLHLAAWAGHAEVVKLLLTFGHRVTLVNLSNADGDTPLHYASQFGHTQCCQVLLKYAADPAIKNAKGEAPLDLAAFYGRLETVEAILRTHPELMNVYQHNSPSDVFRSTPIHLACRNGHKAVVDLLVAAGIPVSILTSVGTALHEAALFGKVDVAKRLIELGIDISAVNSSGENVDTLLKVLGTPAADQILSYIQGCDCLVQIVPEKTQCVEASEIFSPGSQYENILIPEQVSKKKKHNRSSSVEILLDHDSGCAEIDISLKPAAEDIPRRHHKSFSSADSYKWSNVSENSRLHHANKGSNAEITLDCQEGGQITRGSRAYSSLNCGGMKELKNSSVERRSLDTLHTDAVPRRTTAKAPQKPPRKVNTSESDHMNRRTAYELIYLAHSGAIDGITTVKSFDYSDSSRMISSCFDSIDYPSSIPESDCQGMINKNIGIRPIYTSEVILDTTISNFDESHCTSTSSFFYAPKSNKPVPLPRKYLNRSYENVLDGGSSTPSSTQLSTPEHPPPPPYCAEKDILAQLPKRKSRDIETETDMPLDLSRDDSLSCYYPEWSSRCNSEASINAECVEEYITDSPFEGLVRCSIGRIESIADTLSFPTPSGMSHSPSKVESGTNTDLSRRSKLNRDNSLTILSPFDEQDEWAKITEILGTFGEKLGRDSLLMKDIQKEFQDRLGVSDDCDENQKPLTEVGSWLRDLGLKEYEELLVQNGFDDLRFLGSGLLEEDVLLEIGVVNSAHRHAIASAASQLTADFIKPLPSSVEQWLASLNLSQYIDNFKNNLCCDMDKVVKLWEIELVTVLEIVKYGHIRRILFSLDSQNRFQFKALDNKTSLNNDTNQRISDGGLSELGLSVEKLKDEIIKRLPEETSRKSFGTLGKNTLGKRKNRPAPLPPVDPGKKDRENLNIDELSIRGPKDLLIGFSAQGISEWKHSVSSIVKGEPQYLVEYLGTTRLIELKGTESTKCSIEKLKKKYANKKDTSRMVLLKVSIQGVSFSHPDYEEAICEHAIRNIHCACQDADDMTHFAYITEDRRGSGDHFCQVFRAATLEIATEIIMTLGQAFEVAFQLALKDGKIRCHLRSKSVHEISQYSTYRGHERSQSDNILIATSLRPTTNIEYV
ncbi:ankyrin repeat and SAM domain-containing protein 1A-like isoform X2 [Artemia franciscana]|uniref:ankyrin repeat and SAM domain-containing protein 1A-like isoform X2 n=1 Tax=Artemia franciscana TaxID=6661 RepID=UPI0032DA587F